MKRNYHNIKRLYIVQLPPLPPVTHHFPANIVTDKPPNQSTEKKTNKYNLINSKW